MRTAHSGPGSHGEIEQRHLRERYANHSEVPANFQTVNPHQRHQKVIVIIPTWGNSSSGDSNSLSNVIQPESSRAGVRPEVRHEDCPSQVLRLCPTPSKCVQQGKPSSAQLLRSPASAPPPCVQTSQTFQTSLRWSKVVGVRTVQGRVLPQGIQTRAKGNKRAPRLQPYHLKHFFLQGPGRVAPFLEPFSRLGAATRKDQ